MLFFRPLSVLASRLPSLLWGIDTAALYDTVKAYKAPVAPLSFVPLHWKGAVPASGFHKSL